VIKTLFVSLALVLICSCSSNINSSTPIKSQSAFLIDLEGKERAFDDYLGAPTLLIFWASWCGECLAEMNILNAATRALARSNVQLIAVAIQDDLNSVNSLPHSQNAVFPILIDIKDQLREKFPVDGLPTAYLLDENGGALKLIDPEDGVLKDSVVGIREWQTKKGYGAVLRSLPNGMP
jgi:thiol-disulfide isomerase/thioredoxin